MTNVCVGDGLNVDTDGKVLVDLCDNSGLEFDPTTGCLKVSHDQPIVVSQAAHDFTGVEDGPTIAFTPKQNHWYRVTAVVNGTQITADGTPTFKLLDGGTELYRMITGVPLTVGQVYFGKVGVAYIRDTAALPAARSVNIEGQDTAGAFRTTTGQLVLSVEDLGISL